MRTSRGIRHGYGTHVHDCITLVSLEPGWSIIDFVLHEYGHHGHGYGHMTGTRIKIAQVTCVRDIEVSGCGNGYVGGMLCMLSTQTKANLQD